MSRDFTQEAWDEYMSTGIDPTGGELGPDFDPDTGRPLDEYQEEESERWQKNAAQEVQIKELEDELESVVTFHGNEMGY